MQKRKHTVPHPPSHSTPRPPPQPKEEVLVDEPSETEESPLSALRRVLKNSSKRSNSTSNSNSNSNSSNSNNHRTKRRRTEYREEEDVIDDGGPLAGEEEAEAEADGNEDQEEDEIEKESNEEDGEETEEAAAEEVDEEVESEEEITVEGDDQLSEEDGDDSEPSSVHSNSSTRAAAGSSSSSSSSSSHRTPAQIASDELSSELSSPDPFQRKYSHGFIFNPRQIESLSMESNARGKMFPFKRVEGSIPGVKEMIFVSGDASTVTPPPAASTAAAASSHAAAAVSSVASASASASSSSSPLTLPLSEFMPLRSIADVSLHVRPRLVGTWRRSFVEAQRRKFIKQQQKKKITFKSMKSNETSTAASSKTVQESSSMDMDEIGEEDQDDVPKDVPLTPPSTSFCPSDCFCFGCSDFGSSIQSTLFRSLTSYRDVILTNATPLRNTGNQQVVALHLVNHLTKCREKVLKHNTEIAKYEAAEKERKDQEREAKRAWKELKKKPGSNKGSTPLPPPPVASTPPPPPEYHDQGFTRPRILGLFPTAHVAYGFLQKILSLIPEKNKGIQQKRKRMEDEFAPAEEDHCDSHKSLDYKYFFDGKSNDSFRLGISLGNRAVKFYTPFTTGADLIIASPLGIRMITGSEGDKISERDRDFLSSIEIIYIDSFDVLSGMQNMDHLTAVMDALNRTPFSTSATDFSRLRGWNLEEGHSAYRRQNIILASHASLGLQSFQSNWCRNNDGRLQFRQSYMGILSKILPSVKQIFQRISTSTLPQAAQDRFDHFTQILFPQLKRSHPEGHVLLYFGSYFDFIRVRNWMKKTHQEMSLASEYTTNSALTRGRSAFFHGETKFLLMTERFHFFRRYVIRGVKHVVFYSLPTYEQFFVDVVNWIPNNSSSSSTTAEDSAPSSASSSSSVLALFTRYDSMELERIVGTQRATKIIQAHNQTHMFC